MLLLIPTWPYRHVLFEQFKTVYVVEIAYMNELNEFVAMKNTRFLEHCDFHHLVETLQLQKLYKLKLSHN